MRRLSSTHYRTIGISLALVILSLFGLAAPAAADDPWPFSFTGTGVVTKTTHHQPGGLTQVDNVFTGTATYLGNYTATGTGYVSNQENFTYTSCLLGANGTDSVCVALGGHLDSTPGSCEFTSTGSYIVTGGTGAFVNATGGGTFTVQYDPCAGTTGGTLTGTISQPYSG